MNEAKNSVPIVEIKPTFNNPSASVSNGPKIVRIQPISNGGKVESKNTSANNANFAAAAKIIEPAVDNFVGILNGAAVKFVYIASDSILEDETAAERLSAKIAWSEESRAALKVSGSRIIAKRYPDSDFMDVANIAAAFGEMGIGLIAVTKELLAIRKLKIAEANKRPIQSK